VYQQTLSAPSEDEHAAVMHHGTVERPSAWLFSLQLDLLPLFGLGVVLIKIVEVLAASLQILIDPTPKVDDAIVIDSHGVARAVLQS